MTEESLAIAKIIKSVLAEDKTLLSNYEVFLEKIKAAGVKGADYRAISNAMQYKISEVLNLTSTDSLESIQEGRRQLQTILRANNMLQNRIDFIVDIFDYAMGWQEAEEKMLNDQESENTPEQEEAVEIPPVDDSEVLVEDKEEPWTCPQCGREGNQKNFCGKCGCPRPEEDKIFDSREKFHFPIDTKEEPKPSGAEFMKHEHEGIMSEYASLMRSWRSGDQASYRRNRKAFQDKYGVVEFSCINAGQRITSNEAPIFKTVSGIGDFWAIASKVNKKIFFVYPSASLTYENQAHNTGGMKESFNSNYYPGIQSSSDFSVEKPALFVQADDEWHVWIKGKLMFKGAISEPVDDTTPNTVTPEQESSYEVAEEEAYVPEFKSSEISEPVNQSSSDKSLVSGVKEKIQKSNISVNKKIIFGAIAAVIVLIIVLVHGTSSDDYQKNCDELYAIAQELPATMGAIDDLQGDASAEDRKKVYDNIQKHIDKLNVLDKDLTKMQQEKQKELNAGKNSDERDLKKCIDELKDLVEFETKFLTAVQGVINYDKKDTGELAIYKSAEYEQLINNYATIINNYRKMGNKGLDIKDSKTGQIRTLNADELMCITGINDALVEYCDRKHIADARILNKMRQDTDNQRKENNEALMKKDEVVFLTRKIYRGDNNTIKIEGNFYNGTKDNVAGIKDHLLDITLKAFDDEVFSVQDEKVTVSGNTNLAPGASSANMTVTYTPKDGKVPYFTTAEASIHKIHWIVRRVVKK